MIPRLAFGVLVVAIAVAWTARDLLAPGSGNPPVWVEPYTGIEFVLVPAQLFQMGSPDTEPGRQPDETLHPVDLSRPFYIGRHEVTQGEWARLMETRPSQFGDCDRCPIERVSFLEAQEFIRRLRAKTGAPVRLPTEAEWELSCRSGGGEPFGHRSTLSARDANIDGRYPYNAPQGTTRGQPTTVGRFAPTPWGLFDMTGNVWEWVEDRECPYPPGRASDPLAACGSPRVIIRGGSWDDPGAAARCSHRGALEPHEAAGTVGFRLAKDTS
jgi:formylglycine-generating enzyme required for sulfatase activity